MSTKQFLTVLLPISISINLLVVVLLATVTHPTLQNVNKTYYTWLTPRAFFVGIYWLILGLVGIIYSVLPPFISATVPISQLVPLPVIFLLLPLFAVFYLLRLYLVATCIIGAATLLAGWAWIASAVREWKRSSVLRREGGWRGKPEEVREGWKEWMGDWTISLFLSSFLNLFLPHLLLLTFGWYEWKVNCDPEVDSHEICFEKPKYSLPPHDDMKREWITFGIISAAGFIDCGIVFWKCDVVWTLANIYLFASIALGHSPKPPTIFIPLILFSALLIVTLIAGFGYQSLMEKRALKGRIRLEDEEQGVDGQDDEHDGINQHYHIPDPNE